MYPVLLYMFIIIMFIFTLLLITNHILIDNVTLTIDGILYLRVFDAYKVMIVAYSMLCLVIN